ncbi:hypothetical protein EBH_0059800 [Eimeria brunetti]|uniref:Uncharacterized protein n=1 Tax=Eimeria brunetti TaxID=51314 RepID=U6LUK5_9EIME|nr:hypothetical protein EBH_0059800 [Eimeria brunetti]
MEAEERERDEEGAAVEAEEGRAAGACARSSEEAEPPWGRQSGFRKESEVEFSRQMERKTSESSEKSSDSIKDFQFCTELEMQDSSSGAAG